MTKAFTYLLHIVALFVVSGCETSPPPVPTAPSYQRDVLPIFEANCTRCHGRGGTLNADDGPQTGAPTLCYLNMYDDAGDCSVPDGGGSFDPSCKRGAKYCATPFPDAPMTSYIDVYVLETTQEEGGMPPLPNRPLNEREKEIVRRWEANPIP